MRAPVVIGLFLAGAVPAQSLPPDSPGARAFVDCARKADDADRLACYDRAAAALSATAAAAIADRQREAGGRAEKAAAAAAEAEADRFGSERVRALRGGDDGDAAELTAAVAQVQRNPEGRVVLVLENGQVWRQADIYPLPAIRPGSSVTITQGALGSYRVKLAGANRTAQVVRVR